MDEGVADPQAAAHVLLRACVQAVFEARNRPGSPMAVPAFDRLDLDGRSVMGETWRVRRKRLEDLLEVPPRGVCLVPVTDDAPGLWVT